MVLIPQALMETQQAFDTVAATYADSNAESPVLGHLRRRLRAAVREHAAPPARLLDLGCGPGEDVEHFARAGFRVTAVDSSLAMVEETQRRIRSAGIESSVEARQLGIHELARLETGGFDAAYSDFGPLNCVPDLGESARRIGATLQPGGVFVASVIGRICPWEIALYGLRREWKRIAIRFSRELVPVPFYGRRVWMRYYSASELVGVFRCAGFVPLSIRPLGLVLPPPYLTGFATRHPGWIGALARIEDRMGSVPVIRGWGDHFLVVLRKT